MKTGASLKNRQGGAVAVMVGISMVVLVGFLALVLDLGHLYIAKTELQNAADAAALAGAKELNGTASGVASAVTKAVEIAKQNRYDFSKPVAITIDNIRVGNCPDPDKAPPGPPVCVMVSALSVTTDSAAANKYFIEVDTHQQNLDAWVAPIWNIFTTSTFGMAVAGRYMVDITPIAMCALDVSKCPPPVGTCTTPPCECGYEIGKAYDVAKVNKEAGGINPGTILYIDPLATSANCTVTNTNDGRPFICQGKAAVNANIGGKVYTNTGNSDPFFAALDSRFNDYPSQGKCDPTTAPPDENVKEYLWGNLNNPATSWMTIPPLLTTQTANVTSGSGVPPVPVLADNQGVVWSFVRPEGNPIATRSVNTSIYLASPWTPYTNLVTAPTGGGAAFKKPDRRVLNMIVVACPSLGPGVCQETIVAGVGRFLMQRKANTPSSDQGIFVEYGGFIPGGPNVSEYKLYR